MGLNKQEIQRSENARIEIIHPQKRVPSGCFVTIAAPGTEIFDEASDRMRKRRNNLIRKYRREDDIPSQAAQESYRIFLADVTTNLEGYRNGDEDVPYSRQAVLELYEDLSIAAQISGELADMQNFYRG